MDVSEVPEGWEKATLENTDERWIVHAEGTCRGDTCAIHKRTNHSMRGFPQHFRADRALMERICSHGVGHPDPDDLAYHVALDPDTVADVHGCDGCCAPEKVPTPEQWVARFLAVTHEQRLEMAERVLQNSEQAYICLSRGHIGRITNLSAQVLELTQQLKRVQDRAAIASLIRH